jgi:hypothetical protein
VFAGYGTRASSGTSRTQPASCSATALFSDTLITYFIYLFLGVLLRPMDQWLPSLHVRRTAPTWQGYVFRAWYHA